MKLAAIVVMISLGGSAFAGEGSPLDDPRLGAGAAEARALVADATREGLPADLLLDKLREGLAKGVPPARLVAAERALAQALGRARIEAQPVPGAAQDRALLKAIVDAHSAGAAAGDITTLLKAGGRVREIEVLTDLAERGYPPAAAAQVIAVVSKRSAAALGQLVAQAERLRAGQAATPAEVLDAVQRTVGQGLGLERAAEALHHGDVGDDNGRGPDRETSGARGPRSGGVAAPGHNKGGDNGNGNGKGHS